MLYNRGRDATPMKSYSHLVHLEYFQFDIILERKKMYPPDKLILLNISNFVGPTSCSIKKKYDFVMIFPFPELL